MQSPSAVRSRLGEDVVFADFRLIDVESQLVGGAMGILIVPRPWNSTVKMCSRDKVKLTLAKPVVEIV
jgi:hypothetical protein